MLYVNRSTIIAIILLILRSFQRKGLCNSGLKAKSTTFVRNITTIRLRSQFVILKMNINMTIMVKNTNLNELYISSKEFEALNKCDSEIRYSYTLKFYEDGNSHPHNYKIEKSI